MDSGLPELQTEDDPAPSAGQHMRLSFSGSPSVSAPPAGFGAQQQQRSGSGARLGSVQGAANILTTGQAVGLAPFHQYMYNGVARGSERPAGLSAPLPPPFAVPPSFMLPPGHAPRQQQQQQQQPQLAALHSMAQFLQSQQQQPQRQPQPQQQQQRFPLPHQQQHPHPQQHHSSGRPGIHPSAAPRPGSMAASGFFPGRPPPQWPQQQGHFQGPPHGSVPGGSDVKRPRFERPFIVPDNGALFPDEDEDEEPLAKRMRLDGLPGQPQRVVQHIDEEQDLASEEDTDSDDGRGGRQALTQQRMRVDVDLTSQGPGGVQQLQEAGEELQEEDADVVLERCEHMSKQLRAKLGGEAGAEDRYAATEEAPSSLVKHSDLIAACGDAAKYFKPYQLVGVNFLMLLKNSNIRGSILADEMGLGKTAQAICFLGAIRHLEQDAGPHLIVVPASLIENWQRELAQWCPSLKVVKYYGPKRSELRHELKGWLAAEAGKSAADMTFSESDSEFEASDSEADPEEAGAAAAAAGGAQPAAQTATKSELPFNVMLTCYTLFERESSEQQIDRSFLKKWRWSHLLMDEAHAVKNASAARTRRLLRVAAHCRRRIMLTGTPLQNDLQELQNLLRFLLPDVFQRDEDLVFDNLQDEEEVNKLAERMRSLLGPFVLRRLKSEVASQLSSKRHRLLEVSMSQGQAQLYKEAFDRIRSEAAAAAVAANGKQASGQALMRRLGKQRVNNMFTHLRKIAQHPLLVRSHYTEGKVLAMAKIAHHRQTFGSTASLERVREELASYSDFGLHRFALMNGLSKYLLEPEAVYDSGKFVRLKALLEEVKAAGSRPLIFSQWTSTLDVLEWLLDQMGLPYVRLDGNTAVAERLATVDQFNDASRGVFAFLLSTRAGGQGLNLTGADTVILHDIDFNPQIDKQAEDRCHRLGQTKQVTVYRMVTVDSVDQAIFAMAQRKLKLDAAVMDGLVASSKGRSSAAETAQMGQLLQQMLAGEPPTAQPGTEAKAEPDVADTGAAAPAAAQAAAAPMAEGEHADNGQPQLAAAQENGLPSVATSTSSLEVDLTSA